jgi:hypothetical protein
MQGRPWVVSTEEMWCIGAWFWENIHVCFIGDKHHNLHGCLGTKVPVVAEACRRPSH